jgi:NhaP-type Na+/H+ or K+/H+ antiporter
MYETLALIAAFIFLYSLSSGRLNRTIFSGAIIFTALGFIFGPLGLDVLKLDLEKEGLRILAEMTLALVLFIDAANANLDVLKKNVRIPSSLLLIGLPLTILLGFGFGVLIFNGLTLIEIAIIATILAPTDAALGKAVVTNESVPANIREGLSFESGLNDGICVPILFIFLALASHTGTEESTALHAILLVLEEVGIGAIVGVVLALIASWLFKKLDHYRWILETWKQLPVIALAIATFSLAQYLGGSGFIACFVGGLLFGWLVKEQKHKLLFAAEGGADTLAMITWLIFGAIVVGHTVDQMSWEPFLYAVLSLTIIRMVPVFFVLLGTKLNIYEKLFIGWFGPRGLASIVFGVIVLNEHLPGGDIIRQVVGVTIFFSVVLHGISAHPFVNTLAARIKRSE